MNDFILLSLYVHSCLSQSLDTSLLFPLLSYGPFGLTVCTLLIVPFIDIQYNER